MPSHNIPQSTIDKITEQIMAKFRPALDDAISRAITATVAATTAQSRSTDSAPIILKAPNVVAPDFGTANWIWTHEVPHYNPPFGSRAFRKVVIMPPGELVDSMLVDIGCQYVGYLYVNGRTVGGTTTSSAQYSIKFPLTDRIVIVVSATQEHGTNIKKPAGLIISAVMWHSTLFKGHTFGISTDGSWETSLTAVSTGSGFEKFDYHPDDSWNYARVEGLYGMDPWKDIKKPKMTDSVFEPTPSGPYGNFRPSAPLATPGPAAKNVL